MFGSQDAALASVGCTAFTGSFVGGAATGNVSGTGFSAGDILSITVVAAGGVDSLGLYDDTNHNSLLLAGNAVGTRTYVVPANTPARLIISGTQFNAGSNFTWSCVAGSGTSGAATPSQQLSNVQTTGSSIASNTSVQSITAAVANATIGGFSAGGSSSAALQGGVAASSTTSLIQVSSAPAVAPLTSASASSVSAPAPSVSASDVMNRNTFADLLAVRQRGVRPANSDGPFNPSERLYRVKYQEALDAYDRKFNEGEVPVLGPDSSIQWVKLNSVASPFAPERRFSVSQRADEAFAALGYAAIPKARRSVPMFVPLWTPWIDVRGTGFEHSDASTLKGTQLNATGGLTYRFSPTFVAGVYAGFETFKYDFAALNGSLKGNGGSIGTYAGWQITPTLTWTGMVGWTGVSYDGSAQTASGSFSGSRWIAATGLTGNYRVSSVIIEPSASIFALTERQTGYTDTLAVAHAARNFSNGRVSLGGKVSAAPGLFTGFTPYVGLYGDWAFASNNAVPVNVSSTGLGSGWSARTIAGASIPVFAKSTLSLGGELGGIGASYKTWTGNARLSVPF